MYIFEKIQKILPSHRGIFTPQLEKGFGLAMFIKKDINIYETKSLVVHEALNTNASTDRLVQAVSLSNSKGDEKITICDHSMFDHMEY